MVTSTNRPTNRQGEYRAICLFWKLKNRKKAEICNSQWNTTRCPGWRSPLATSQVMYLRIATFGNRWVLKTYFDWQFSTTCLHTSKWAFGWLVDLFIFGSERRRTQFKEYWRIFCHRGEEREPRSLVVAWWQRLQWRHQHGLQKEQVGFHFKNSWMIHEHVGFHQRKTL